jgi:hypothetical protein
MQTEKVNSLPDNVNYLWVLNTVPEPVLQFTSKPILYHSVYCFIKFCLFISLHAMSLWAICASRYKYKNREFDQIYFKFWEHMSHLQNPCNTATLKAVLGDSQLYVISCFSLPNVGCNWLICCSVCYVVLSWGCWNTYFQYDWNKILIPSNYQHYQDCYLNLDYFLQ